MATTRTRLTETWYDRTRRETQELELKRELRRQERELQERETFETRHQPMTDRVQRIIRAMPAGERGKDRPLSFFVAALAPKYHGARAAPREVTTALRALGWQRRRVWSQTEPSVVLWSPPVQSEARPSALG